MSSAAQKLTETKTALLLHQPFFASLLLDMMKVELGKFPHIFPPGNETMATDGRHIWIDEDFMMNLRLPEAVFVICHEVGHAMWLHMSRGKKYQDTGFDGKPFNHKVWNMAGDYVINDMLIKAKIGKMPSIGLHDTSIGQADEMIDDVYRRIMKQQQEQPDQPGQGGPGSGTPKDGTGNQGPDGVPDGTLDTHVMPSADEHQPGEIEWKRAVASARSAAKSQGKMPAGLERLVDEFLNPKVDWTERLRTVFIKKVGREAKDWNRLHRRRFVQQGIVMPAYKGFGCGTVVFGIDSSGSMSDKEIGQGFAEADAILLDCLPERVFIVSCDAQVETVIELNGGDSLQNNIPPIGGGGGTSFIPVFEWCVENGITPDVLVYFTDMGGTFPDKDYGFPVIWCSTVEGVKLPETCPGELIEVDLS